MLKLCGFRASNYFNKVKLALLEKGIPFEEETLYPSREPGFLARSPLGKVPFIEIDGTTIAESQVIIEYLEERYPEPPLYPRDPLERAKVRELIQFLELHLELVARRVHPQAFFGRPVSDEVKAAAAKDLARGVKAFARLAKFSPFIAGDTFTYADCAGYAHLPMIGQASRLVYGRDVLDDIPEVKPYIRRIAERATAMKVNEERKAAVEAFKAHISAQAGK